MAGKITTPQDDKERGEAPEKEMAETSDTPLPLLDLSDAAVKKLIRSAKRRGHVTHDQINSVLSSEEVNSEQIEDVLTMFSEMGVNVVETEEAEQEGNGVRSRTKSRKARTGNWLRSNRRSRPKPRPRNPPSASTTLCALSP